MHIDAASLTVVDLTTDHCGVGVRLYFKASYPVPVDVTALEISLGKDKKHINYDKLGQDISSSITKQDFN